MIYLYQPSEYINDTNNSYEESKYLFKANPGYIFLLEYLTSPLASARSFAIKHFLRANTKVLIFYINKLIEIASPDTLFINYTRNNTEEDIFMLLVKIGLSSAICLSKLSQQINLSFIYKRNQEGLFALIIIGF